MTFCLKTKPNRVANTPNSYMLFFGSKVGLFLYALLHSLDWVWMLDLGLLLWPFWMQFSLEQKKSLIKFFNSFWNFDPQEKTHFEIQLNSWSKKNSIKLVFLIKKLSFIPYIYINKWKKNWEKKLIIKKKLYTLGIDWVIDKLW